MLFRLKKITPTCKNFKYFVLDFALKNAHIYYNDPFFYKKNCNHIGGQLFHKNIRVLGNLIHKYNFRNVI